MVFDARAKKQNAKTKMKTQRTEGQHKRIHHNPETKVLGGKYETQEGKEREERNKRTQVCNASNKTRRNDRRKISGAKRQKTSR